MGCRYCEIACPFNVPRFEWDTPLPSLTKCQLCPERRAAGLGPACVERCKRAALVFGGREELLAEAHRRIEAEPEQYNAKVYGEYDGGGTSVLYLAKEGVCFAEMGLPELGHGVGAVAAGDDPAHAVSGDGGAGRAAGDVRGDGAAQHAPAARGGGAGRRRRTERSEPVGGKLLTWPFVIAAGAGRGGGGGGSVWRFVAGLGAATNLNDGYPMGLWIAFDVVTGTALACGGYAMALLVYLANRGKYHPLVRARRS